MKKAIRTAIIATIITCMIIISCAFTVVAQAESEASEFGHGEFYPKLAIVFETEQVGNMWIVYCVDRSQNQWSFFDDEGAWKIGDIANLLMWCLGENEEEDEIVEVYWEGYTDNLETFFQVTEWRR